MGELEWLSFPDSEEQIIESGRLKFHPIFTIPRKKCHLLDIYFFSSHRVIVNLYFRDSVKYLTDQLSNVKGTRVIPGYDENSGPNLDVNYLYIITPKL